MTYRRGAHDELHRSVEAFEVSLRELAWDLAARVIADELSRRPAATRRTGRRAPIVEDAIGDAPRAAAPTEPPDAEPVAAPAALAAAPDGKRIKWTRERVIAELCEWLISGIVEPAFLRRHGKPGLVTAATRIFGRFDSALNVANLYLAKQYPDGPPAKRAAAPTHARAPRLPRPDAAPASSGPTPANDRAAGANGANANGAHGNGAHGANGANANGANANGANANGAHGTNGANGANGANGGNGTSGNGTSGNGTSGNGASANGANANGANTNGAASSPAPPNTAAAPGAMSAAVPGAVSEIAAAHDARASSE